MAPSPILFSRNVMARHRELEGAKDRATDGSNKKGVQLNDQGIGQQLGGMHSRFYVDSLMIQALLHVLQASSP